MATLVTWNGRKPHKVVSREAWLDARKSLLAQEKKLTRELDRLKERRRSLPWVKVEKEYIFEGPDGPITLAALFAGKHQLIVYHFMFAPDQTTGCAHCSFWADHFDGAGLHLGARDTAFAVISRAPWPKLRAFQQRMGWKFRWLSSGKNEFNYDFGASFRPEDLRRGTARYNYAKIAFDMPDREGASAFYRDDAGDIYHTYSTFARGIDALNTTYHLLDLTAKGRDENPDQAQDWVRYHDKYRR